MADITPLGNFGSPAQVDTTGLAQALIGGANAGEQVRSNRARESTSRSQIAAGLASEAIQSQANAANRANQLQLELAKIEQDKEKEDRDHANVLLADLSAKYNAMKPDMQEMFQTHPHFKAASKFIASHLPERVDAQGQLIMMDDKDVVNTGIENIRRNNAQILANGGQLTEGQQRAQDMLDKADPQLVSVALDHASKDPGWEDNPDDRGKLVNEYIGLALQGKGILSKAKSNTSVMDDSSKGGIPGLNLL